MKILVCLAILLSGCAVANNTTPYGASGGYSVISYLQKQRDGVVFQETFENYNFLNADGWTVLRGSPANSQAQAVAGISSWDNTAGNQSMPIAEKVITDTNVDTNQFNIGWLAQAWFYDPITTSGGLYTTSTYPGPYIKWQLNDGSYASVGVRNSVSTSFYSYSQFVGPNTDSPAHVTTIPRTNGWHLFNLIMDSGQLYEQIDGNFLTISGSTSTEIVSGIYVQAGTSSDSGSSFGYFDNVAYYRNGGVVVNLPYTTSAGNTNPSNLYNSNNVLQYSVVTGPTTQLYYFPSWVTNTLFPESAYFEFYNQPQNALGYRTPLMNINPGDIYQLQQISFGRKITTYDPFIKELQSVSQSTAGVRETNNYGIKSPLTFSVNSLQGWSWKQAADNFFLNAVQGNPFGLMVDNISDNAFGVIGTSAFGGSTKTVQIMRSIIGTSTNTTSQFMAGNYYYIRNNAGTQKQLVNLVSMTTSTLTFDQNLNWNVNPLDYVYSLQYYPFLEVAGDTQAFKCDDPMIPRFKWTQNCVDYLNG